MEQTHQDQNLATDKVLAFDTIFTTNHIKMLKVLLSFLPPSLQKMLAVYIKFLELQFTLTYFDTHPSPYPPTKCSGDNNLIHTLNSFGGLGNILGSFGGLGTLIGEIDLNALCKEILPYCSPDERKKLTQFQQMQQMMDNFQHLSQTMEMMKDLFPDGIPGFNLGSGGTSDSTEGSSIPFGADILSSLFSGGDNSQMFDMLAAMMGSSNPFSSDKNN